MKDILLKDLLEAGCHFGHKTEKWHPKAASFIFQEKGGIHIIDLAQTRDGLKKASEYVKTLAQEGKTLLFIATKRQAKGVVTEAAKKAACSYLTNRWIGGFITNWPEIKKNIDKLLKFRMERLDGSWKKFPKHEIVNLEKILRKLEAIYGGVAQMTGLPDAVFVVDIKKEDSCVLEAVRKEIPVIAIVDTNADPYQVDYPIPANDDAVGSIRYIVNYLTDAFLEGKNLREKQIEKENKAKEKAVKDTEEKRPEAVTAEGKEVVKKEADKPAEKPEKKKTGRPKKV